jgi:hypothetical protein
MFASTTFPAVVETGRYFAGWLRVELSAEQAIATATVFPDVPSQRGADAVPAFFLERLTVSHAAGIEAHLSHFAFNNLAESTAYKGRLHGNSGMGMGPAGSQLTYAFQGIEAGASYLLPEIGNLSPRLTASGVLNTAAPSDRNRGYSLGASLGIPVHGKISVTPRFELFQLQSDATPAAYNMKNWGHANRHGFAVGADVDFGDGMSAAASYIHGNVISGNPYQSDIRYLILSFRSTYEIL